MSVVVFCRLFTVSCAPYVPQGQGASGPRAARTPLLSIPSVIDSTENRLVPAVTPVERGRARRGVPEQRRPRGRDREARSAGAERACPSRAGGSHPTLEGAELGCGAI